MKKWIFILSGLGLILPAGLALAAPSTHTTTRTPTPTGTRAATASFTVTPGGSTPTFTATFSTTPTSTPTATPGAATPTATPGLGSATSTTSPTRTRTVTATPAAASATSTRTATRPPTWTATPAAGSQTAIPTATATSAVVIAGQTPTADQPVVMRQNVIRLSQGQVTRMSLFVGQPARVLVQIYTVQGKWVATLADEPAPAGILDVTWAGLDQSRQPASTGIYIALIRIGAKEQKQKIMVVR